MWAKNDLLNDILPMVISGIFDPEYITGEDSKEDEKKEGQGEEKNSGKTEKKKHGRS